jgi:hypothetical protein
MNTMLKSLPSSSFAFVTAANLTVLVSCKANSPTREPAADGGRRQFSQLYATSESEQRVKGNYYYQIFKKDYELHFAQLPTSGGSDRIPYAGSWFPQSQGGTSRDLGNGNVLLKYDKAFHGGDNKAVKWEQDHHTVSASDESSGWAGHCNGFSAAATRHEEPQKSVKRGDVEFFPKDIKALLAEVHMAAKFYFLGGNRCAANQNAALPSPSGREDTLDMGDCDDVNPGTFHTAVTNWLGIQKYPIIMDVSPKEQVWNYPHFRFKVEKSAAVDAAKAMTEITGTAESTYRFNPAAVQWMSVTTKVEYAKAFKNEYLQSELKPEDKSSSATYTYILELDKEGRIIGGEWTGTSIQSHPDFVWVAFEPAIGSGEASSANPEVNPADVIKLWAESVGQDPNNPKLGLMEPAMDSQWGKFTKFQVSINQGRLGTAFAGSPITLKAERTDALAGDMQLDVAVNGQSLGKTQASGKDPTQVSLGSLSLGIHTLEIKWLRDDKILDFQRVRIVVL